MNLKIHRFEEPNSRDPRDSRHSGLKAALKLTAYGVCLLIAVCCRSGAGRDDAAIPAAATETPAVTERDSVEEMKTLSAGIFENFPCGTIDSAGYVDVSAGVARFRIKGRAAEKVAARTMHVQSDSTKADARSYIFLHGMEKDKSFAFDALCIPSAGTMIVCPDRHDGSGRDEIDLILVSKRDHRLRALDCENGLLIDVPAATGRNPGNKKRYGDKKTPEGIFSIYAIHDASEWDYDFHDGKGPVKGCYGKYFVRFKEYWHIGIHGTHLPGTVGSRATEACIRLQNDDIERIVPMISVSETLIAVTPAYEDMTVQ
ncbi:MAG: L,D-transpeptidase [Tannerella sp.]|jgi:hypothetical protein|nr:L,D-transpeptidase [Tannerella sp.]